MSDYEPAPRPGHGRHSESWWAKGLLSAVGGLVFSVLLSAVLVALAVMRFEPVLGLERAGIDMAMKVYVSFPTLLGNVPRRPKIAYAFIDIDEAACRAFVPATPDACGATKAAPAAAVAAVVDALRASDAKVVIVDVAPPNDAGERQTLAAALTGTSNPWIIAPIETRPTAKAGVVRSDSAKDFASGQVGGQLLMAALTTFSDPTAPDGLVRHYPPAVKVEYPGGRAAWLPTAPFLAAALVGDPRNVTAVKCLFYGAPPASCGGKQAIALGERRFTLAGGGPAIKLARDGVLDRISYSLPALGEGDTNARMADQYRGLYDRFALSDFDLTGGTVHLPPHLVDGRIVVIGSSQAAGHDWHSTPVGAMPGGEIVLNAARGFVEFAPAEQTDPDLAFGLRAAAGWANFLDKIWPTVWMAVFTFLPAWLLIALIADRTRRRGRLMALGGGLLCAIVFLAALGASFGIEVFEHSAGLRAEVSEGRSVDFISPIFALGLEGYADASTAVAVQIEAGLAAVVALVLARAGRRQKIGEGKSQ